MRRHYAKTTMAGTFVLAIFFCTQAAFADVARDMARCVQNQLNDLGFDAGPADGSIGPRTLQAARAVQERHPLRSLAADLPPLNRYSAVSWCRGLPRLSRETGRHRPFLEPLNYAVADDAGGLKRNVLERALNDTTSYYRGRHGQRVVSRLDIAAASSAAAILRLAATLPSTAQDRKNAIRRWSKIACGHDRIVTGIALRNALLFCWPASAAFDATWAKRIELRLGRIMVHEMMHILQNELAHEIVPQTRRHPVQSNKGPDWLVEGAAEVMADHFIETRRRKPFAQDFRFDPKNDTSLRELHKNLSVATQKAYGVANLAVLVLARRHGHPALFAYWKEIGRTGSTETAFESAFGMSLANYEAVFEELRGDPERLLAYASGKGAE